ncbi:MAG: SDR family oxidoreductase [Candidatus Aenigmarchaeota archaeon]|nr:SDR family oxidoreductase [Candidatus Aenigmarchaeota archaeon]
MEDMKGKVVLITGATSGIGKETAIAISKMGATVIFLARDKKRAEITKKEIINLTKNRNVDYILCDLASFNSIKNFVKIFKSKYKRLDVLVNNAGIWNKDRKLSKDDVEETFAVNYLALFLLTTLLLDLIKKSKQSRIVNVTSGLHRGTINFDDVEFEKSYSGMNAYSQSKLAVILFTRLLSKKLEGTGVTVNCVHPGLVATNLARNSGAISKSFFKMFGKTPKKGAETSIYVATSPDVENVTGEYFTNSKISKTTDYAHDMDVAERLWKLSENYLKNK